MLTLHLPAPLPALAAAGAVEVRREVSQLTGLDLPATLIFDYPSIAEIAAFVSSKLPPPAEQPLPAAAAVPDAAGAGARRKGSRRRRERGPKRAPKPAAPAAPAVTPEQKLQLATGMVRTWRARLLFIAMLLQRSHGSTRPSHTAPLPIPSPLFPFYPPAGPGGGGQGAGRRRGGARHPPHDRRPRLAGRGGAAEGAEQVGKGRRQRAPGAGMQRLAVVWAT